MSAVLSLVMVVGALRPVLAQDPPAGATSATLPTPTSAGSIASAPAPTEIPLAPSASAPSSASAGAPASSINPNWPLVTFQPDNPKATLERWEKGEQSGWKTVCEGPCTITLDWRHGYRVHGDGVVSSQWFKFPKTDEPITLKAETGSTALRTAGHVMAWGGPILSAVGLVILAPTKLSEEDTGRRRPWDDRTYIGGSMLLGGALVFLGGLAFIGASGTTTSLSRTPPPVSAKKPVQVSPHGVTF
ncbi:MAG: hypothetical protein RMJ98_19515 [Myxococcales bacterium]|nr:hypothetical protein [Polyangiaceae bacterium]MDW8251489.1 hypothetical protein [Myxococcales bacterium]